MATGIFNSGTNIGAIVAPLSVPFIADNYGWRMTFVITGAVGLIWLLFWFMMYEIPAKHKNLHKAEFDYIHSDTDEVVADDAPTDRVSWFRLLKFKQTWGVCLG